MFNPSYPLLTSVFDPRLVLMRSYAHNPQWPCDRCDRLPSKVCLQRHFVPSPLPSMPKSRVFCRLACCSSCLPSSLRNHSVCTLQSSLASSSTLWCLPRFFTCMFFQCSLPLMDFPHPDLLSNLLGSLLQRQFFVEVCEVSDGSVDDTADLGRHLRGWNVKGNVEGGFVVGASQGGFVEFRKVKFKNLIIFKHYLYR